MTLTEQLCKVTIVAKYKILKSRQDEVAKLSTRSFGGMKGKATYSCLSEVVADQVLTFPKKGMLDGKGSLHPL